MRIDCCGVALILALMACGAHDPSTTADPQQGFIDGSGLDAKFLPSKCDNKPCYVGQAAFARGEALFFYNLGTIPTATFPAQKAASAPPVYTVPECDTVGTYEPMRDAFAPSQQLPLFSTLPLTSRVIGALVLPFVNVTAATHPKPFACNAVKDAADVSSDAAKPGKFGLTPAGAPEVRLWAVVDPTVPLNPTSPDFKLGSALGWYKSLLLTYLDGGPVPVNEAGELVAMDGIILDPAGLTTFAKTTDPKVILLPFKRGEAGFSPIVRLHSFRFPSGKGPGDFTGICLSGMSCGAKEISFIQASPTSFNTVLIAAQ